MSQLTHFSRPIIRHLPSLNLVVRFDDSGISVRAYRCRKWKSVTWAQLASLADESEPVVRFCETDHGSRVLMAMGVRLPLGEEPNKVAQLESPSYHFIDDSVRAVRPHSLSSCGSMD